MNQQLLKEKVAHSALSYIRADTLIGIGTGSTVNCLIAALPQLPFRIRQAVSSSEASSALLRAQGIEVIDANAVTTEIALYIDGADEINPQGHMIKGGGAALTREKITAAMSAQFLCIADASKWVETLGQFPLPVEVIPMASAAIMRRFAALGAQAQLRLDAQQQPLRTDNGQWIVDVRGLSIDNAQEWEARINQWAGVVTVGIFAQQGADICLLSMPDGSIKNLKFQNISI